MADSDFSVKAIISAQTSQFEKGMKDAQKSLGDVSKSIQGVSNLLKSAFSVAGIALSVKAVTDFGSSCVKAADEANKSFSILNNTINVTGATSWTSAKKMEKMSIEISDATNYSVGEIQDMQSVLLGFRNITGDTFREASDAITDMATVMGMDLKSAVQTVGKALDDPIKGLDSLKRQGFAFTEQQKEELAMLVKTGKQMEAQKIILDELNTTYGGAAKAAQSATARWNNAMDSLKESIGNQLMPAVNASTEQMTKIVTKITEFVNSSEFNQIVVVLTNIANKVKEVFVVIGNYISNVFTEIMEIFNKVDFSPFKSILDTLLGSIIKIIDTIKNRIDERIKRFKAIATEIGNIFSNLDLKGISEYINAFIDGFWFIYDEIQAITQKIQDWITEKIIWIWEKIKELFNNSNDALANSESSIKSWGDYFWTILDDVFRIFQDLINSVKAIFDGDWAVAWEYAKLTAARWADGLLTMFSTIANAFPQLVNGIITGINKIIEQINKLREFLGDDPIGLIEAFSSVDLSKKSGLTEYIAKTEKEIERLTGKTADIAIKNLKGLSKESEGTFDKLKSEITSTSNLAKKSSNETKRTYTANTSDMSKESSGLFDKLNQGWLKVKEAIEKDANDWSDVVKTSYTSMMGVGTEMFTMMGENLAGAGNSYEDFSAKAVEALSSVLKSLAAQLSAVAALRAANYDYASAALAAAGAAAALVAAGTLSAVASNMKKTSDATKDASMSLAEFRKKLNEIWSGETTSISVIASIRQIDDVVKETTKSVENATKKYNEAVERLENAIIADKKRKRDAEHASGGEGSGVIYSRTLVKEATKELEREKKKLKEAQESYLKGLRETDDELKNQIKEYEKLNEEYKTLYSSLNGYTSEMVRSQAIVSKYASIIRKEMLANTKPLLNTVYNSFSSYGKTIGENLMDSIVDGATKSDFLNNIKEYTRNQMLQLAIYTDSFTSEIADIGTEMVKSLMSDGTGIDVLTDRLEDLYERTSEIAGKIDETLEKSFSKFGTVADEALNKYDELSAKLKELTQNATQNLLAFVEGYRGVEKESDNLVKTMSSLYEDSTKVLSDKQSSYQHYNSIFEEASKNAEYYATELSRLGNEGADLNNRMNAVKSRVAKKALGYSDESNVDLLRDFAQVAHEIEIVENSIHIAKERYKEYSIEVQSVQPHLTKAQDEYNEALENSNNIYAKYQEAVKNYTYLYEKTLKDTSANLREQNETLTDQIGIYKKLYTASNQYEKEMLGLNVLNTIKSQIMSVISDVANAGVTIGDTLISSILNGADSAGFLSNMKSYIKENVIKLAVYTESFQNMLADVGTKMIQALTGGNKSQLESLKTELESLYETAKKNAEGLEKIIDDVFPSIKGTVGDSLDEIEDSLTSFGKAMKNFNDSIKDMGGDIASQLVNGLTNGLGQSDFLKNMKDWIKKMLVQSVVYTESMKSEIEAIGKSLTSAIANGFSEDSMHAIRRDLSYIFEQANKAVGSIDSVLSGVFSGYADGTTSALSGLHIVGERGPELVRFNGGERVYNNTDTMRMIAGAGKTNNFNVTFNNLQDTSAFEMMNQLKQYNREMAINGVL